MRIPREISESKKLSLELEIWELAEKIFVGKVTTPTQTKIGNALLVESYELAKLFLKEKERQMDLLEKELDKNEK